jgi:hypothetical protein
MVEKGLNTIAQKKNGLFSNFMKTARSFLNSFQVIILLLSPVQRR